MSKYSENMPPKIKDAVGWMIDYIEPNSVFLDFGCSTGYFGSYIKQTKHAKVYGLEISDDIKEAGKVLDGVYSFDLDGEWPAEIYERTYDYLFFGDVIEHLKDPQKVLEKCRKLLKKDGLIFISTPNIAHISIRLELMGGNFDYEPMGILDNTHLKYFTRKNLTELIQAAGYTVKHMDFSANDYPDKTVTNILKKLGLTPDKKFWDMVNKPEARAFQHKVVIGLSDKPLPATAAVPNKDKPEFLRNAEMDDLRTQVQNLRVHAEKQAEIIAHYVAENERLKSKGARALAGRFVRAAKGKSVPKNR